MPALVPTCVWRSRAEVLVALHQRFGDPVDSYVNGSQVWLRDDGPGGLTLEWRLHPVPGFRPPKAFGTYELFGEVAGALGRGAEPPVPIRDLWEGLEAFPAYGEEAEPALLTRAATDALGITPDAAGLADHQRIGDEWERTGGKVSIVDLLIGQLTP